MVDWDARAVSGLSPPAKAPNTFPSITTLRRRRYGVIMVLHQRMQSRAASTLQMFNSFLDGTKSAIEMAATSNSTGLLPPHNGLLFRPSSTDELPSVLKPKGDGGVLEGRGMVEVVSSLQRDGTPIDRDLRWGVYVTFAAGDEYVRRCFKEYGLHL